MGQQDDMKNSYMNKWYKRKANDPWVLKQAAVALPC